jgi:hypothetical protein
MKPIKQEFQLDPNGEFEKRLAEMAAVLEKLCETNHQF